MKWQRYGTAHSTWKPVKAFVLDGGRINEVLARFCFEHQPKYNFALKKCRELSQRSQKQNDKRKTQAEEAEDLSSVEEEKGDRHQEPESEERAGKKRHMNKQSAEREERE